MARSFRQMAVVMIIPALMAVSLAPRDANAWVAPPWIDKIALVVMEQKTLSTTGNFTPYFQQVEGGGEAAGVKSVPYAVLLPLKREDKLDPEEKALTERMTRFAAAIREQDERAALGY